MQLHSFSQNFVNILLNLWNMVFNALTFAGFLGDVENLGLWPWFSTLCINIPMVPPEILKTLAFVLGFQQFPQDLSNFNT